MRKDRQYSRLRHRVLGYLPSQFITFRQVAEGTRDRAEISTRVILKPWRLINCGKVPFTKPIRVLRL
jgi:hypothetical protein